MEMRGENGTATHGDSGSKARLVFGSYAAKAFTESFGVAVLGRTLVVPPIAGGLALRERRSAVSAQ